MHPAAKTFRIGGMLALLVGVAVSAALIAIHSFSAVAETAQKIGWGLIPVLALQCSGIALNGFGWRMLFRAERPELANILITLRWIRESINYLLPVARLGGDIVAVRMLVARGRDMNTASAGVIVDKTVEVFSLLLFALSGLFLLLGKGGNPGITHWAVRAMIVICAIVIALLLAQRWGLLKAVDKAVSRFAGNYGGMIDNSTIHDIAWSMYADGRRVTLSIFLHTVSWLPGAVEIWVALRFMGHPIGLPEAFIVESLCQVVCAAAFVMPAALGAQEAAYMTIGMLFGIPPTVGLAVSLVLRLKDVLFGIPGLLAWQGFEGRRLWDLWNGPRDNNGGSIK
jgi:putative membrane protein